MGISSNILPCGFCTLSEWRDLYRMGATPDDVLRRLRAELLATDPAWISLIAPDALANRLDQLKALLAGVQGNIDKFPLYGIPFAVKDNIDVAGFPTTCACPEFVRWPAVSAEAVARLEAAGAVVMGKTNLDQFATGLVGTRSPYGVVPNAFDERYISGGSSSGSASVVARGLVPFSLGTDTAGSGRVPAGYNNLVGLKPTRGRVSTQGVVPACRSLDCVSVFAMSVEDAEAVLAIMTGFDAADPYSRQPPLAMPGWPKRPLLGIPAEPEWYGDQMAAQAYADSLQQLESMGVVLRELDFSPLFDMAALLYQGPWVSERFAAIEDVMRNQPQIVHPVVRGIIEQAANFTAVDAFKAEYQRMALARQAEQLLDGFDGLLVPTAPFLPTIEAVLGDPVVLNSRMGRYTNFVNLLDWSALALPGARRADGLPAGITLIGRAWQEASLVQFGLRWQACFPWRRGASSRALPMPVRSVTGEDDGHIVLAVVGAHLSGMPLNSQLTERRAQLLETTCTSSNYRLYALPGTVPAKPGLVRAGKGAAIEVELWRMPVALFGSFVALVPAPLAIGSLELADGRIVKGFICEAWATAGAEDITGLGGWRAYMAKQ